MAVEHGIPGTPEFQSATGRLRKAVSGLESP
jgi:hypothetical protein